MKGMIYDVVEGMQLILHSPLANFAEHDFASHVENFCRKFVASQMEIKT
jgi:hypothetical protein